MKPVGEIEGPKLAPPGAGVPAYQRWVGKHVLLPIWCRRVPWDGVPELMERQAGALISLADGLSREQLVQRVLVPPQIGLEDSSRYHSWSMVLEHLTIIGHRIGRIVVELTQGRVPEGAVNVADLKPRGGLTAEQTISDYRTMLFCFRRALLEEAGDREPAVRYAHPWFGPLTADQWSCFAPFHQTIHVKQARRIRKRLPP